MDCSLPGSSVHGDSPGKNTGLGWHALLQWIFPTQGSNPGLPQYRQILNHLSDQGNPRIQEWVAYLFYRGYFWPRNQTRVSCFADGFFTSWTTMEAPSIDISTYLLKTVTSHPYHQFQSIHWVHLFLSIFASLFCKTTRLHYLYFICSFDQPYCMHTSYHPFARGSPLADILCWAASLHGHPSHPCLSAPPGTSSLCSLSKSSDSSWTVCAAFSLLNSDTCSGPPRLFPLLVHKAPCSASPKSLGRKGKGSREGGGGGGGGVTCTLE